MRNQKLRRMLSVALASAMVLTQTNVGQFASYAEETQIETSQDEAAEAAEAEARAAAESEAAAKAAAESEAAAKAAAESEAAAKAAAESEAAAKAAAESEAAAKAAAESEAAAAESEAAAKAAAESEAAAKAAAESEAAAKAAAESEAARKQSEAESEAAAKNETEQKESESETLPNQSETQQSEKETESSQSETALSEGTSESETASESLSPVVETEQKKEPKAFEKESVKGTESEAEKAVLEGTVLQQVENRVIDGEQRAVVKYTVRVSNKAIAIDAQKTTIKAVLPTNLIVFSNDVQTTEAFHQDIDANTIYWDQQTIAAGTHTDYVFFAVVAADVVDTSALKTVFYINDILLSDSQIRWENTELLMLSDKIETEFETVENGTETEIPETEAQSETETELLTESESESESETEKVGPTHLSAKCSGVKVTVTAEEGVLAAGTTLSLKRVSSNRAGSAINTMLDESQNIEEIMAFDVALMKDGEEVQPDGKVRVTFSNLPFTDEAAGKDSELLVAQMSDSLKSATELNSSENGTVSYTTESLSVLAVALITTAGKTPINEHYTANNSFGYTYTDEEGVEKIFTSPAFDFHIFAVDAEVSNHTNGNIAVENFSGNNNAFGTNQNREDGINEYNYIGTSATAVGQIAGGVVVLGSGIDVSLVDNDTIVSITGTQQNDDVSKNTYQEQNDSAKFIDIEAELEKLKDLSVLLAKYGQSEDAHQVILDAHPNDNNGKLLVDLSDSSSEINYLNVTAAELVTGKTKPEMLLSGVDGKTLIINVDMTNANANTLAGLIAKIEGFENGEDVVRSDCNLLWNFYQRDEQGNIEAYSGSSDEYTKIGTSDYFMGTILAPDANVQYGALNGSVIAHKTKSNSQESHNWKYTGLSHSIKVNKKFIAGSQVEKTFYFALFTDAEGTQRVADQRIRFVTLKGGQTGSVTFSNVVAGVTYYVFETDGQGVRVGTGFEYDVTGSGAAVTPDPENSETQTVTIINTSKGEDKGNLEIRKSVTLNGQQTTGKLVDGEYAFEVRNEKGDIVASPTITITNGRSNTVAVGNLTPGVYTVSEKTGNLSEGVSLVGSNNIPVTVTANNTANIPTASFTNNRTVEYGSLKITKNVLLEWDPTDTTLADGVFTFNIRNEEGKLVAIKTLTITNGKSNTITVDGLVPGTYKVSEDTTKLPRNMELLNAGNNGNEQTVVVSANDVAGIQTVAFTNNKKQVGSLRIQKNVTVNGETTTSTDADGTYSFTIKTENGGVVNSYVPITITNGRSNTAEVGNLQPGTYVVEENPSYNGTTLSESQNTTIVVEADNEANIPTAVFTNDKSAMTGTAQLAVTKQVSGTGYNLNEEFTFTLSKAAGSTDASDKLPTLTTVNVKAGETGKFGDIKYTKEGTYYYTITETAGSTLGMTYDTAAKYAKVVVSKSSDGSRLEAVVTYGSSESGATDSSLTVTNTYVKPAGMAQLSVTKEVTGNTDAEGYNADELFSFTLASAEGNKKTSETLPENLTETAKAGATATFGTISYTEAGTYYYTITEGTGITAGMTYDTAAKYAKVEVKKSADGKSLETAVTYGTAKDACTAENLTVTNKYGETSYTPEVVKKVEGTGVPAETYSFTLTDKSTDKTGETFAANGTSASRTGAGTAKFGMITYKKAGTYVYEIAETAGSTDGMTYSTGKVTITVTVRANEQTGALTATAKVTGGDTDAHELKNTYVKPAGTAQLSVTKEVTGNTDAAGYNKDELFSFTLAKADGNEKTSETLPAELTETTKAGAAATFGAISYTEAGTYYYTITEGTGTTAGMTYDTAAKYAKVVVRKSADGKSLETAVSYGASKEACTAESLTVTNRYGEASYTPEVVKKVEGTGAPAETYSFTLTDKSTDKTGETFAANGTSASRTGAGTAKFGMITYKKAGTYVYEIAETAGKTDGMTYSTSTVAITVTVTANEQTGALSAAAVVAGGDTDAHELKNTYVKPEGTAQLSVTKEVTGNTDAAGYNKDELFSFTLARADGNEKTSETLPAELTETTKAGAAATFGAISYTEAGTYYYTITEGTGTTAGMTYDTAVKYAKVEVKRSADGKSLETAVSYGASKEACTAESLEVTNRYGETTCILAVKKVLEGTSTSEEVFNFVMTDKSTDKTGESLGALTASCRANGIAQFEEITYTKKGIYEYEITETPGNTDGMVYSTSKLTAKVTVEQNETTGALSATVVYTGGDGAGTIKNKITSVEISKVDVTDKKELADAHIQLLDKDGKEVESWVSGTTPHVVKGLKTGETYTLKETVAPDGYEVTSETTFTLDEKGEIDRTKTTTSVNEQGVLLVEDEMTSVKISKVDVTDGKELPGAHIQILDKDGNVVREWDSTDQPYEVTGLKTGETYTLRETVAPDSYKITVDTTFELNQDGSINTEKTTTNSKDGVLLVEDDKTSVKINKVDAVDGKVLAGAHLQLFDEAGQLAAEWDSTAEAYELRGLTAGKTYTLHETVAPAGYVVNTVDVTFTLDAMGGIDAAKTTAKVSADGIVLVENNMVKSEDASIAVTKQLTLVGAPMAAADQTFYVALYSDEACTNRISDVKPIVFRNASSSTVEFTGLDVGRTYYVGECDTSGTSLVTGMLADGSIYMANFASGNQATVTEADSVTTVTFANEFYQLPPGFYKEGWLTITKRLVGSDGEDIESDEVFYAGIFDDAAYTKLSEQAPQNIIPLELNGNSSVSTEVVVAIPGDGSSTTVYVTEVDENGVPVANAQGFMYEVSVDQTKITLDEDHPQASVTITNREYEEEEEVTEIETETETKDKPVKTGDDTPVVPYAMAQIAAAAIMLVLWYRRRRLAEK